MKYYSFDTFFNIFSSESVKTGSEPDLAPGAWFSDPWPSERPSPSRGRRARLMFDNPGSVGTKGRQPARRLGISVGQVPFQAMSGIFFFECKMFF